MNMFLRQIMLVCLSACLFSGVASTVTNPVLWADIPDVSIVRVDDKYYMSHTTMHMNPGVPIMESNDMVHWKTVSYCYQTHVDNNEMNLSNGKNAYGKGSWASSIRYKDGTFYVLTFSYTSGNSHLYTTTDVRSGTWKETKLPLWHDPSLFLDDDGRNYVFYGSNGNVVLVELNENLTGVKAGGVNKTIINDPASVAGSGGLRAEGAQVYKHNGYYYVFNICWPSGSERTQVCSRSKSIQGPYESKVVLKSRGVAQGSIIQMEDESWMGYVFQDNGSVGRSPWIMPVSWQNDWPIYNNGTAPVSFELASAKSGAGTGIVTSDKFSGSKLKLEWQFNHNPDNTKWSLTEHAGYYRITTGRIDNGFLNARNSLTQRSFGPKCSGRTALDVTGLKDGDCAGLAALQAKYGFVGVKKDGTQNNIVMQNGSSQIASVPISQEKVFFRIDMDFTNRTDKATFFYSLDSVEWKSIGNTLQMTYDLAHFMGYRFALFNYATKSTGGTADFDWFEIGSSYKESLYIEDGYGLDINILGKGKVVRSPDNSGYKKGTVVTLTAEPEEGWMFVNWIQDGVRKDESSFDVTMDTSKSFEVIFARKPSSDGNMVLNGDFSSGTDNWTLNVWDGEAAGSVVDGEYSLSIESASAESHEIQLIQPGLFFEKGKMYSVSFDAYAKSERTLEVNVEMHDDPWTSYLTEVKEFNLTSTKKNFNFVFTMNEATDVNGRISFNVGKSISGFCIDNIKVVEKSLGTSKKTLTRESTRSLKAMCKNSILRVEFTNTVNALAFVELFDMRGNVVKQATFRPNPKKLNVYECKLSGMANGMYIVKLRCGQSVNKTNVMVVR